MSNYVSSSAVADMVNDATVFGTHITGVATMGDDNGTLYVVLVTQPATAPNPLGIVFDANEANDLALSIFQAAKAAKESNDG